MNDLLTSKRFWLAIAGLVYILGHDALGLAIDEAQVQQVVTVIAGWIVGDSIRATSSKKE